MTSSPTIAVAHYPEGAGHATRMLAVADALEARGAEVLFAGGGAGTQFAALNGYNEYEPTTVDYIDTYQGGSIRQVLAESVPATAGRVTDYVEWLRDESPDALVTDDMFAAIAATRTDVPLYALKHDLPPLYRDRVERAGAAFHTDFQLSTAREFFYPAVWPESEAEPEGVTHVPPVALDSDDGDGVGGRDTVDGADPDVVVVPSHYSDLGRIADNLARQGHDVTHVGSDDWEPVASLLPYLRAADVVVCSGYSTVMDAAVAGTPCVVHPATDEQEAVCDWLERFDVTGFAVAEKALDVLDAVSSPPESPTFENGATIVADEVLDDLERRRQSPTAGGEPGTVTGGSGTTETRAGRSRRWVGDRAVAGGAALSEGIRVAALRGRTHARTAKRRASTAAAVARRHAARARERLSNAASAVAATARETGRAVAEGVHRYGTATAAMAAATLVVADSGLSGTGTRLGRGLVAGAETVRRAASDGPRRAASGVETAAAVAGSTAERLAGLRRRVRDAASAATPRTD